MGFSRSFKTVSKSSKQVFKNCQKNLRRVLGWQVATSLSIACYTKPRHKSTIAKVIKNLKDEMGSLPVRTISFHRPCEP